MYQAGGPSNAVNTQNLSPQTETQKPDDYVYFQRSTENLSSDAVARSTAAKLKLASYYKMAVDSAIERNAR
jgi:protein-serine/threonine kinase